MKTNRKSHIAHRFFLLYCLLLSGFSFAAYQRNLAWRDELTLWEDVIKKSSNKSRGYNNVGVSYSLQGRIDDATAMYKTALRLRPDYLDAHNNLGNNYSRLGDIDAAIAEYKTVLRLKPDDAVAHYNMGNAYERKGLLNEAIFKYRSAIKLKP